MYPSIILQNNLYPAHLGEAFIDVYRKIYVQRVAAKKEGRTTENETLKLALNGLTGNLQSIYSWVYDPMMVFKIRINGQLMLLMLIEAVTSNSNFQLIQSNTDGIFVQVAHDHYDEYMNICHEWEEKTGLKLEHDHFERFYQYAINDYIGVKQGYTQKKSDFGNGCAVNKKGVPYNSLNEIWKDYIKKKGLFISEPVLGKGLAPLIIPEAIDEYFIEGISPEETIRSCKDIKKFCTFQKVAKEFTVFYGGEKVAHINRYYMSTDGKMLFKQKVVNGEKIGSPTALCASSPVTIYNRFDDIPIEERCINYQYYILEAYKIIEKMDKKQLSLW